MAFHANSLVNEFESDVILARQCAIDRSAREQLFLRYAPLVYPMIKRIMRSTADAEDVLQEIFVEVFRSVHRYRGDASLQSWLRRLAIRHCMRHLKRSKKHDHEEFDDFESGSAEGTDALVNTALQQAMREASELLSSLPPNRRIAFVLHHVEGHSLKQCGELLGTSETAAKKLVWRARKDLSHMAEKKPALRAWIAEELT